MAMGMSNISAMTAWLGALAYTLQIFNDFSGYSDMAIGLGRMLGFEFPKNFDRPYASGSVTEFWRRWHISLGTWFREYVYIPLGGNRKGVKRQIINLLIVVRHGILLYGDFIMAFSLFLKNSYMFICRKDYRNFLMWSLHLLL